MLEYKKTFHPSEVNHSFELPEMFYGKEVEVSITIKEERKPNKNLNEQIFSIFGKGKDFPELEEVRNKVWPNKW